MGPTPPTATSRRIGIFHPPLSHKEAETAVTKLFQAAGFTCFNEPRIGGISSLPISPDILAFKDDELLILEIKVGGEKDVPAEDANGMESARRLLATRIASSSWRTLLNVANPTRVDSALVMIGAKPSAGLKSFAEEADIRLLPVDPEMIRRVMQTDDKNELRSIFSEAVPSLPARDH